MKIKMITRFILLSLFALTLVACHEHETYYEPQPEVIITSDIWRYDNVGGYYYVTLTLENIGDDAAYNIEVDSVFGNSNNPIRVYDDSIRYLGIGERAVIVIDNLAFDYRDSFHAKVGWYDYYGYYYSNYY